MPVFTATEFNHDLAETGRTETYIAKTVSEAVKHCLYTKQLRNRCAKIGPSGRVVYDGYGNGLAIVEDKEPLLWP